MWFFWKLEIPLSRGTDSDHAECGGLSTAQLQRIRRTYACNVRDRQVDSISAISGYRRVAGAMNSDDGRTAQFKTRLFLVKQWLHVATVDWTDAAETSDSAAR